METDKVLFIINKVAGGGFEPSVEGRLLDICAKYNSECTIEFTQRRHHATELASEGIERGFKTIIAVGGDGTINEVARSLVNTPVTMGIIPKGSGNGLGRHLGISLNMLKAAETIFTGKSVSVDTLRLNGQLSLNVSGIGFDGHVANLFGKDGKRGLIGYIKLVLGEFFSFKEFPVDLTIDGESKQLTAFIVAVANSSQYGNNARIAPLASIMDQELHVTVLKKVPLYELIPFALRFMAGKVMNSTYCKTFQGKRIEIKSSSGIAYHIDGEPSGMAKDFLIEVQPKSLNLIVPSENDRL